MSESGEPVSADAPVALLDIGTNTVRLLIGELQSGRNVRFLFHTVVATRLGEGLSRTGSLSVAGIERTIRALKALQAEARSRGARLIEGYATAWARSASNTDEMLICAAEIDLPIWILTGEEEAALSLDSAKLMSDFSDGWVVDLGGGSCEIIRVAAGEPARIESIQGAGAVSFTENFLAADPPANLLESSFLEAEKFFERLEPAPAGEVIALGGTAAALGALKVGVHPSHPDFFDLAQRLPLEKNWIGGMIQRLAGIPLADRKLLPGMEPERADILIGGAILLHAFLSRVQAPGLTLCLYSFIHGLLARRLGARGTGDVWIPSK